MKILLIEDSIPDTVIMKRMLPEPAYDLVVTGKLEEALRMIKDNGISLILLDLGLPDSWGSSTFVRVCEEAWNIPVIILTSLIDDDLSYEAARVGAQDYLIKGQFTREELVRAVRYAVERKANQMEQVGKWRGLAEQLMGVYTSMMRMWAVSSQEVVRLHEDVVSAVDGKGDQMEQVGKWRELSERVIEVYTNMVHMWAVSSRDVIKLYEAVNPRPADDTEVYLRILSQSVKEEMAALKGANKSQHE